MKIAFRARIPLLLVFLLTARTVAEGAVEELAYVQPPYTPTEEGGILVAFFSQNDNAENGFAEFQRAYDNFVYEDATQVARLGWRGSFDRLQHEPIESFTIAFWSDDNDQPSVKLHEEMIEGTANQIFVAQELGVDPDAPIATFDYWARLADPFPVEADTPYWISIMANVPTPDEGDGFWGWHIAEPVMDPDEDTVPIDGPFDPPFSVNDRDDVPYDGVVDPGEDRLTFDRDLTFSFNLPELQPGDADQNLQFDQFDIIKALQPAKYLSGLPATWGEGDWDGAPGGQVGTPPHGNGFFDQFDVIAALTAGNYRTGPYAGATGGTPDDEQTSLVYDAATGELGVNAPVGTELTSVFIQSAGSRFLGEKPAVLDGPFDSFAADNIFKSTIGSSFGDISFGLVLSPGLSEESVAADLTASGSLAGGGGLGPVDLIYIPEPTTVTLLVLGLVFIVCHSRRPAPTDS